MGRGDTIALMAKFRPARGKARKKSRAPQGGIPCVILVISGMLLVGLFLYYVMTHANR
jgi:hypothetical protein